MKNLLKSNTGYSYVIQDVKLPSLGTRFCNEVFEIINLLNPKRENLNKCEIMSGILCFGAYFF